VQDDDSRRSELLHELLRRTHLSTPSDLAPVVVEQANEAGARDVVLRLADYEQSVLVPLPGSQVDSLEPLSIAGTLPGRAFSASTILPAAADEPGWKRLWIPLLDGTERLGALAMTFPEPASEEVAAVCERDAHLVAMLVVSKGAYSDVFEQARRRRQMTIASELVQSLAPPRVFATVGLVIAGLLEPAYDNGGDALDYAVNDGHAHLGIFDAMGHGLAAAGAAAFALAAYRSSRRGGRNLVQTHQAMTEAVGAQFPDDRFVTALIAELDRRTGSLRWISAGHPPPLLVRGREVLPVGEAGTIAGAFEGEWPAVPVALETGDVLVLYTDGVTDAMGEDERFGERRLQEALGRLEGSVGERLAALRSELEAFERGPQRDDTTVLVLEYRGAQPDEASRPAASSITDSRLQKANRTSERPASSSS